MSDTDLENRLRADAERRDSDDFALLDFDEALDLAVRDEKHERTRRSALRWAAAAAAVVTVAGVAAAVAWKSPAHRTTPTAPPTVTYRGHVYTRGPAPVEGLFLDAHDPARLDVLVRVFPDSAHYQCVRLRPSAVVAKESAAEVTLRAEIYQFPSQSTQPCFGGPPEYQQFTLHLTKPLGHRSIVNATDSSSVPVIEPSDLPVPSYLPSGFRQIRVEPAGLRSRLLEGARVLTRGQAQLTVLVGPPGDVTSYTNAAELVTEVAGGRAEVHRDENGRCITWPTRPGIVRQVCASGSPLVSAAELVKIARGLR